MKNDRNLQFITRSIADAGQVMVYRSYAGLNKQAIGIKNSFTVDENGLINFKVNSQYEENIATAVFPVDLLFYRKGISFYIIASGIAETKTTNDNKEIFIKMDYIEFVKTEATKQNNYFKNFLIQAGKITGLFV
ncbi:hypothetical protein BH10BAC2_BH10BAC2_38940 [soil metagenome]